MPRTARMIVKDEPAVYHVQNGFGRISLESQCKGLPFEVDQILFASLFCGDIGILPDGKPFIMLSST